MSVAADRFWLSVQRRVAGLQPDVQAAILRAFKTIRDNLSDADLVKLVEQGGLDRLFSAFDTESPLSDANIQRALLPYRQEVRSVVESAFETTVRTVIPEQGKIDGTLAVMFDHTSQDVITAIRTMETKVLATLPQEIRDTVRAYIENGIRDGKSTREIAKNLRSVIGLSPSQFEEVENYRLKLATGRSVTGYSLRDKRYDGKPMSLEQLDRAVEAYKKRRIALNAETNARTATLNAYKQGQQLAWNEAIDAGVVDRDALQKTWRGVLDSRERPEHVAMEGETVGIDEPYSNGEIVPGSSSFNCRCVSFVTANVLEPA